MNPAIYVIMGILLLLYYRKITQMQRLAIAKVKRKGRIAMSHIFDPYIGKECVINIFDGQLTGIPESVQDNWLVLRAGEQSELVNVDYIKRIREYPKKKNGKKKSILWS